MQKTIEYLKKQISDFKPQIGVVLGSGLGFLADKIDVKFRIPYEDIPDFPVSTVEGHAGNLVFGVDGGKNVVLMQGRFHAYEGYSLQEVTFPIRTMIKLGIKQLIVTNASGGINPVLNPGTLMIIEDHINFMGNNPLIGKNDADFGPRFPDMSHAYSPALIEIVQQTASKLNIDLAMGVYLGTLGPSFETPAEIRAYKALGADAVGMSTVPECIIANHAGIEVCGISCITNKAAGLSKKPLSHQDVTDTANKIKLTFSQLIRGIIASI